MRPMASKHWLSAYINLVAAITLVPRSSCRKYFLTATISAWFVIISPVIIADALISSPAYSRWRRAGWKLLIDADSCFQIDAAD
jgi:hypothetical protein